MGQHLDDETGRGNKRPRTYDGGTNGPESIRELENGPVQPAMRREVRSYRTEDSHVNTGQQISSCIAPHL